MKKRIFLITISVIAGILLALQVRSFKKIELLIQRSEPGSILNELKVFQIANSELRRHIEGEKETFDEIQSQLTDRAIEDEIRRLQLLTGEEAVRGEGIEITFSQPIEEFWITDLIAQLVSSGAEAISMNDIRLLSKTAGFRSVSGGILMRRYFLKPPFRLMIIGPRQELHASIGQHGGILSRIENAHPNLKILLAERDSIIIPAFLDSLN